MKETGIERVAVIGAGLMGFGVAVEFARFGYQVSIYNTREESSKRAMEQAREALDLMVETELITAEEADAAYARLNPTIDFSDAATGADFVHESVLEILDLKKEVFAKLDEICPPPTILATNTSSLKVSDIASATNPSSTLRSLSCAHLILNSSSLMNFLAPLSSSSSSASIAQMSSQISSSQVPGTNLL